MIRYLIFAVTTVAFAQGETCSKVASIYRNSIVHIQVQRNSRVTKAVEGTGFILSGDGYLLTSARVVPSSPDPEIEITGALATRNAFRVPLSVVTVDDQHGLALLQFDDSSKSYQPLPIGEPQELGPGDRLCSLGFPLQQEFQYSNGALGGKKASKGRWSTDMSLKGGESGAPVFDDKTGKVVAVKDESLDAQSVTFASRANACHASGLTIAQLLGHSNSAILPTYVKPLDENTKAVIEALDAARTLQSAAPRSVQ